MVAVLLSICTSNCHLLTNNITLDGLDNLDGLDALELLDALDHLVFYFLQKPKR